MTAQQLTAIRDGLDIAYKIVLSKRHREKIEEALVALNDILTDPDAELQACDRCYKISTYNGDWYCGLCPNCADETEKTGREIPMKEFTVYLQKDYWNSEINHLITLVGSMVVQADSQEEAEDKVRQEMRWRKLQTTDPRIEWDDDCCRLSDEGYEYVDFSFKLGDET